MKSSTMKKIRWGILFANILIGFLFWFQFPSIVPIHFNRSYRADSWGSKLVGLLILFLPLYSCIPWEKLNPPEIHVDSEESRQILEEAIRKREKVKLVQACVLCAAMWCVLLAIASYIM